MRTKPLYRSLVALFFLISVLGGATTHAYILIDSWPDLAEVPEAYEFGNIQGLAVDSQGKIHVADPFENTSYYFSYYSD